MAVEKKRVCIEDSQVKGFYLSSRYVVDQNGQSNQSGYGWKEGWIRDSRGVPGGRRTVACGGNVLRTLRFNVIQYLAFHVTLFLIVCKVYLKSNRFGCQVSLFNLWHIDLQLWCIINKFYANVSKLVEASRKIIFSYKYRSREYFFQNISRTNNPRINST